MIFAIFIISGKIPDSTDILNTFVRDF